MSDLLIKGMEMPTNADMAPTAVWVYPNGHAIVFKDNGRMKQYTQAVPVPPHGGLIEKNAVFKLIQSMPSVDKLLPVEFMKALQEIPTVIPASEEAE